VIFHEIPQRGNGIREYVEKVRWIVDAVIKDGDRALLGLTERLDGVKLDRVAASEREIEDAVAKVPRDLAESIDLIYQHLYDYHVQTKPPSQGISGLNVSVDLIWEPIGRIGIYVPKGRNSYPSTLLMTGIPALVAGVEELYVASAPSQAGLDPLVAYISKKIGVKSIYRIGGPQAIAAMAYGTETVRRVDKIVGPGGLYVQAAKLLISDVVGIDGIEGPTELVVLADDSANWIHVAQDLAAQAEHGPSSVLVLLSTSNTLLSKVEEWLKSNVSPENTYHLVKVKNVEEAIELANSIAPEHLSLHLKDAEVLYSKVRNAGVITLGNTPPALVDYCAGPSHVLPTSGWARFRGGLSIYDFMKLRPAVKATGIDRELWNAAMKLADYGASYGTEGV